MITSELAFLNLILSSLVLYSCFYTVQSNLEVDGSVNIKLFHSLVNGKEPEFTERGNISILSLRLGQTTENQKPLSQSERQKLADLSAKNGFYKLRSVVTANDGTQTVFYSSVKACMLAEAELNDILSVSLDYSGRVIAVTMAVASTATCEGAVVPPDSLKQFTTSVFVRHTLNGPIPDTASYILKLEREKEARERGEVKDNRSFLAKYWMYIIPVVVIMVISSAANPEAGGQGGAAR